MTTDIQSLQDDLLAEVAAAADAPGLEAVRVAALGKKGRITAEMKGLGQLAAADRRAAGAALNKVKEAVAAAIEARKSGLREAELEARLARENIDVTLPVRHQPQGRIHPIVSQSFPLEEAVDAYRAMREKQTFGRVTLKP